MSKNLSNSQFDEADSAYYTEFDSHLNNILQFLVRISWFLAACCQFLRDGTPREGWFFRCLFSFSVT